MKQVTDKTNCAANNANKIKEGTSGKTGHTIDECKALCLGLSECTGINWGSGDGRCWALNMCANPRGSSGWEHYILEGNCFLDSSQNIPRCISLSSSKLQNNF